MDLDGRVALVTGGGRGIGRAIALALAEGGADVAVVYRRDAESATATVKEIEGCGRHARGGRVCSPEDVAGVVRFLVSPAAGYVTGQVLRVDGGGGRSVVKEGA